MLAPRISVFTLLVSELGQTFSLDNGVAVQSLVNHWLQASLRKRARSSAEPPLLRLKRERQARAVWWEARMVRIWTWPVEVSEDLVTLCRTVIQAVQQPDATCPTQGRHVVCQAEDICRPCTRAVFDVLAVDYKCITLENSSRQ